MLKFMPTAEFGRNFFVYGGARYQVFTTQKTYGEALAACGPTGNLVEIFDAELNAIVVAGMQQLVESSLQGRLRTVLITPTRTVKTLNLGCFPL